MCVLFTHNEIYAFPAGLLALLRIVGALYTIKHDLTPIIVRVVFAAHDMPLPLRNDDHYRQQSINAQWQPTGRPANMAPLALLLSKMTATADKINDNFN
ncbi:hypothetical protein COO59_11615 [Mixta theicola]|uniref:Uncharacterized protein n=2 Tax=Mixta theicola TaxID=1458355 RepID=A0A2K1Q9E1_9GAMM|nr:hypothetical protein COO59_11615 [Mixta theicola]